MNADNAPIRVYVREGGSLRNVAACGIDDLGFCLLTLREEREIEGKLVGIMYRPEQDKPGMWLVEPWQKKENRTGITPRPLMERFLEKIDKRLNGCWIWTGNKNGNGYGFIVVAGMKDRAKRHMLAHRLSYLMFVGVPDDGMEIMHTCDNPACVNPDHLKAGTHLENMRDMDTKKRCVRSGVYRRVFTPAQMQEILGSEESSQVIATRLGMPERASHIRKLRRQGGYKDISPRRETLLEALSDEVSALPGPEPVQHDPGQLRIRA